MAAFVPDNDSDVSKLADQLIANAQQESGLTDFDDRSFVEDFRRWLSTLSDIPFSELGQHAALADIQRHLCNRLRIARDIALHPEILLEDVSDPIIVLGLTRTGSSKLQRMLATAPDLRGLPAWLLLFPGRLDGCSVPVTTADPRIPIAAAAFEGVKAVAPDFLACHPMAADMVDEEFLLLEMSATSLAHKIRLPSDRFYAWAKGQPNDKAYGYLRKVLQYLQWQCGGKEGKRLVLKTPLHLDNLKLIAEVFPKSTILCCHRHPYEQVRSWNRFQDAAYSIIVDKPDIESVTAMSLEFWPALMRKYLRDLEALGDRIEVIDIGFKDIRDDGIGVARRVYDKIGRPFSAETHAAIEAWLQRNAGHAKTDYQEHKYGVTDPMVDLAYADYIDRYARYF